ncbi:MAG: hypothetical protein M3340_19905 [Actinomycetota bacterium]|nr:hypothetical protein [Actinomycetota bacterium]
MLSLAHLRPARTRALVAAAVAAIALPALGGTASASRTQQSIMQDDHVLFNEGPAAQARALDQMRDLGVDTVHTLVTWRGFVADPDATRMRKGFRGDNPAHYPADRWNALDDLVRGAQARGLQVLVTPTGPAPRWAGSCSASERERYNPGTCRPSASKFGLFVEALARRYSGRYPDETGEGRLPAVRRWSFWNEPNLGAWLSPQTQRVRGRTVLKGVAMYRSLVHAGTAGLRAGGHRRDQVLLGESAPIASGNRGTPTVSFYRALFCVDSRGRRLSGSAARAVGCSKRRRFAVGGVAHHPYTRGAGEPLTTRYSSGHVTIAYTARLRAVIRQGERSGLVPRGTSSKIFFTEFGVSSNPPGTRMSVPLETQAEWINQADYMAYRDPSVRSVAQFALEDDPSFGREVFQTGICFYNQPEPCYPKPAWDAYRIPIYVVERGRNVLVYGQARPTGDGTNRTIELQNRASGDQPWQTVQTIELSATGHLLRTVPARPGTWRLAWAPRGGTTWFSREAVARER